MESVVEMTTEFWRSVSGPEEQHLLKMMSYGLAGSMILASLVGRYVGIPYGRYSSAAFGFLVPARLAWLVQETPSLAIPLHLVFCSDGARLQYWPNRIVLGLFLFHYTYRCGEGRRDRRVACLDRLLFVAWRVAGQAAPSFSSQRGLKSSSFSLQGCSP